MRLSPLRPALRASLRDDSPITPLGRARGASPDTAAWINRFTPRTLLRRPVELGQYVSLTFGQSCRKAGIDRSMGAKGCALDNAVTEAFFASLKKELTRRRSWPTRRELQTAVFAWIEGWYNRRRLHSTLGYHSPADYGDKYTPTEGEADQPQLAA